MDNKGESSFMKKVLVIDDDMDVVEVLSLYLDVMGFAVETTMEGRKALDMIKENEYNYIFCDLKMPDMKGDEVLRKIESMDKSLVKRFILVTGAVISAELESFFLSRSIKILRKPFTFKDIESVVV